MAKIKIAIFVVVVAALAGAGVYFMRSKGGTGDAAVVDSAVSPAVSLFSAPSQTDGADSSGGGSAGGSGAGDSAAAGNQQVKVKTYNHSDPNFSFEYPEDFNISAFPDGENGETVLVQKPNSNEGFQVFISPFDEPSDPTQGGAGPITVERVKQDVPDMVIESPETVKFGGISALAFLSKSESVGRTREVWFLHEGYLYQITGYSGTDVLISKVLLTWKFQ